MEKSTNLVIFDFDGTIVNTMPSYADIATDIFEKYLGMPPEVGREAYLSTTGISFPEQIASFSPDESVNLKASQEYNKRKNELVDSCQLFPDVLPTFRKLKQEGILTGIISSNSNAFVDRCVKRLKLHVNWASGYGFYRDKMTQIVVCRDDLGPLDYIIYVGDSKSDEELADKMHLDFYGIDREGNSGFKFPLTSLEQVCQKFKITTLSS